MQKRSRLATHTSPNEELLLLRSVHESTLAELAGLRAQSQKHKDDAARLQAQVDALAGALLEQRKADGYTARYRHLPDAAEQIAEAHEGAIRMRDAALATTGR